MDLNPKGNDYFGSCPLHIDLTPSFSITPSKNKFYCFSCGVGGGIIQYLRYFEKMSTDRAITKACNLANVDITKMCLSQTVLLNRKTLKATKKDKTLAPREILNKKIYEKYARDNVQEWLEEGIRKEEIDLFEIRIDQKNNRIVYPVYDMNDNFINIKGRTRYKGFKKLGIEKYINYFKIGTMDYFQGANITKKHILQTKEMIIFESLKSVMKLYGNDIKNSCSAEKHVLSPTQIEWILKNNINRVILGYDSDVTYEEDAVKRDINILKRYVNLYIMPDPLKLLGGIVAKNSPIDCGIEIWKELYSSKVKIN